MVRVRIKLLVDLINNALKENLALNNNRLAMYSPFDFAVRYDACLGAEIVVFESRSPLRAYVLVLNFEGICGDDCCFFALWN